MIITSYENFESTFVCRSVPPSASSSKRGSSPSRLISSSSPFVPMGMDTAIRSSRSHDIPPRVVIAARNKYVIWCRYYLMKTHFDFKNVSDSTNGFIDDDQQKYLNNRKFDMFISWDAAEKVTGVVWNGDPQARQGSARIPSHREEYDSNIQPNINVFH